MRIVGKYSHLNGEEYLCSHHKDIYDEISEIIAIINAEKCKTKISKERKSQGTLLYNPKELNAQFKYHLRSRGWREGRYSYCLTTDYKVLEKMRDLSFSEQKKFLKDSGIKKPQTSYKQTDFLKQQVAIEVQFGKYAFVAYDLFVKHFLFYSGHQIDIGIEILPMKEMQECMSSGISYYEGEVYNVLKQGRSLPAVPLLILGIAP
jgi:hypothetical protein